MTVVRHVLELWCKDSIYLSIVCFDEWWRLSWILSLFLFETHATVSIVASTLSVVKNGTIFGHWKTILSFQPNRIGKITLELNFHYVPFFRIWPWNSPTGLLWKLTCDNCNHPIFFFDYLNQECHFIFM